jgi:hypothetical protein
VGGEDRDGRVGRLGCVEDDRGEDSGCEEEEATGLREGNA